MSAPQLNRALVLEGPVKIADGAGGYTREWEALGVLWAALKAGAGREKAESAATLSRVPYRITVRAAPYGAPSRPMAGQRLRDGTRVFNIHAVAEQGTGGAYLTCHAEEEVSP
ncbi:head-tail adaptor protein [Yoonia algicola]|uniref:Head-tail adaptor protein n=1 Tax=Yoonia algicola TaxID=3137368 RepID=A0AAN0MCB3_9RHOB